MTDAQLVLDQWGADLAIAGGDLAIDQGLQTAVLVSLFSDARAAEDDELPVEAESRRGFWADSAEDRFGSKLWLLRRTVLSRETVNLAQDYAQQALRWLLDEGIAQAVRVVAEAAGGILHLSIEITRGTARRWDAIWKATEETDFAADGVRVQILTA